MKKPLSLSDLTPRAARRRTSRRKLRPALLTKEFLETEDGKEHVEALRDRLAMIAGMSDDFRVRINAMEAVYDYVPWLIGKEIPETGAWVRVNRPPTTTITVPPFSQWIAMNDWMEVDNFGFALRRVRIETPCGPVWLFPNEYCVVKDIGEFVAREEDGVFMRFMDDTNPGVSYDRLHYLMSRGIPRKDAVLCLIGEVTSPFFCWFEFRPEYGEAFNLRWPSLDVCPFATQQWPGRA